MGLNMAQQSLEFAFSDYGRESAMPSPVARMMSAFAGDFRDGIDINLGVGYVNEDTLPRKGIQKAFCKVLTEPETYRLALNYGGPEGSPNLIRAIKDYHLKSGLGKFTKKVLDQSVIAVGASGATSILEGIAQILKPGIVITSDPQYYIYTDFLRRQGFRVVAVPEDDEGFSVDAAKKVLKDEGIQADSVGFVYVVTVNNPSCTILSNRRRRQVVEFAEALTKKAGRIVPVFFDKAYESLVHDPSVPQLESALNYDSMGIVFDLDTLSKILAPALRVGYMIGPECALSRAIIQKISDTGFSAPLLNQEAAGYLLDHAISGQIRRVNAGYRKKAAAVARWLDNYLSDELSEVRGGKAGFYFYLTFKEVETHEESAFFKFLSRTTGRAKVDGPKRTRNPRVVYLPGEFCVVPDGPLTEVGKRQFRISYGFEDLQHIHQAIALMAEAVDFSRTTNKRQDSCNG